MFLAYAVQAADVSGYLTGSTQPKLTQRSLLRLPIIAPSLPVQHAIADVLTALDDKVASNRRITTLAEELIQAELTSAVRDDWLTVSVSSLATFVNGGAFTNGASGTGRLVLRIAELNGEPGSTSVYNDLVVTDDRVARPGDILMAWSGSLGVYRWARAEALINQHIFKVIAQEYPRWLVYAKISEAMPEFRRIAADKATTMGHIKRQHLDQTFVRIPRPQQLSALDHGIGFLWDRLVAAEVEAITLATLRDALVPALLAGQLRAPERATHGRAMP
jgi:type I restriction enzyme S subunit